MRGSTGRNQFRDPPVPTPFAWLMAVVLATTACTAGTGATTSPPHEGDTGTTTSSSLADTTSTSSGPPTLPGATEAFQPAPCDAILDPLAPPVPKPSAASCRFPSIMG